MPVTFERFPSATSAVSLRSCARPTASFERARVEHPGLLPVPPMSSQGITAPTRTVAVVPNRSQPRPVCRCPILPRHQKWHRCVEEFCLTTLSDGHALHTQSDPVAQKVLPKPRPARPPYPTDRLTAPLRKRLLPLCLINSTTPSTGTGSTAPPAAAPTPTCSSPPMVNAATSAPGVSAPPNRSAKTVPCSPPAALTPSPPPSLMASGVACPRPSAPATPGAPAARPYPANVSRRRTL